MSMEVGCEGTCSASSDANTISGWGGVRRVGSGGMGKEGIRGGAKVDAEGGDDVIMAIRDEKRSFSQVRISSQEN